MYNRVLLTGGAGYIGSHTYLELLQSGFQPVIFDNFQNSDRSVINHLETITGRPVEWRRGDVRDPDAIRSILSDFDFSGVVHFAALKSVPESAKVPLDYFDTNLFGLINLLQGMQRVGCFNLVFSSSAAVYGAPAAFPVREDAPRNFMNPYGYTKVVGEQMLEQARQCDPRWRLGILRYFNPAGAHPSGLIGEDQTPRATGLFPNIARVALGEIEKLAIFGGDYDTRDGTGERDFIHVSDLARGHVHSLEKLLHGREGHTANLGTGTGYTVLEVLGAYGRACGRCLPYQIEARRPGDAARCYADTRLADELLGFRAEMGLDAMCQSSWRRIELASSGTEQRPLSAVSRD